MANHWLRLWHEMPTDPKFRTVARIAEQPIALVISIFLHLLVAASVSPLRGDASALAVEDLATALDVSDADVEAIMAAMQGRLLDGRRVTGWKRRQPEREDDSRDRVAAYRERQRNAGTTTETPSLSVKREVTQRNAQDKDTDKEKEEEEEHAATPLVVVSRPRRSGKAKAAKFDPSTLEKPVFVVWCAIVELRWKLDGVPEKHAHEAAEVATWLVKERGATPDDVVRWVQWWWHDPDTPGFREKSRPWSKNIRNTWDTAFLADERANGKGSSSPKPPAPEILASFEQQRQARAELTAKSIERMRGAQ